MAGNLTAGTPTRTMVEMGVGTAGVATASIALTRAAGTTYDLSGWTAGAEPNLYTNATTYGSVTLDVAADTLTYTLDNNLPRTQLLATGDNRTDGVQVKLTDGTAATASFAVQGANDAPTIRATSSGETGRLVAFDPDRTTTVIWSVEGGTTTITTQPFEFRIDDFRVTKNGSLFYQDGFGDGVAPPNAPNFPNGSAANYSTRGTFAETAGRAIMDSDAAFRLSGVGTLNPVAGLTSLLNSYIGSDTTRGLRDNSTFDVVGTFDLIRPEFVRQLYGVRLSDATPSNPSNDIIEFVVRTAPDGQTRVSLRAIDSQLNTTTELGTGPVITNFAPGDQIRLRLFHEPAAAGAEKVVHASYEIIRNGIAEPTVTLQAVAPIFRGEDFTRAEFVGYGRQDTDSVLAGTYGSLSINENGAYTFTPNAAGSSLTAGQKVSEIFRIVATDERGAQATHDVVINLTGNGTGNPDTTLSTTGKVVDGYIAGATVFADANGNGRLDAGEASTTTDANGTFALVGGTGPIVAVGGVDVSTGLNFAGRLSAPEGSTVVTPLTTLIVALGGNAEAAGRLNSALGISSNVDLTTFDPVAATIGNGEGGTAAFVAGVSVQNTVVAIASALGGGSAGTIANAYDAIAARIQAGGTLNLTDEGTVKGLLVDTAALTGAAVDTTFANRAAELIATGNTAVANQATGTGAGVLTTVATLAFTVQSSLADTLQAAGGNPTALATADQLLQTRTFTGGTVEQTGAFRQYLTKLFDGDGTITGKDGLQSLTDVGIVTFVDGRIVFDVSDPFAIAYRMYDTAFDRLPDVRGLNDWSARLQAGTPLEEMARGFSDSLEFSLTYGNLSNRGFVEQLYRNVLDREGETAGIEDWTGRLDAGTASRPQVLIGFSESLEHMNKLKPAVQAGLWDLDEEAASIARIYYATLDRAPDAGGLRDWTQKYEGGTSLKQIASGFTNSIEFQQNYGSLDNAAFVDLLYQNVLDREADADGRANWLNVLSQSSREDVVIGFSESLEFQIKKLPVIEGGIFLA